MKKVVGWILVILGGLGLIKSILGIVEYFWFFTQFIQKEETFYILFSMVHPYETILCLMVLILGVSILKRNKKDILFILSIFSFLSFLFFIYLGFTSLRLAEIFTELNIQLPFITHLWSKFWWLLPIIFLTLTTWLFLKYKKTE